MLYVLQFFADPNRSLLAVTAIASLGLLISLSQTLWNWRLFRPDGLLSWELFGTQPRFRRYGSSSFLDWVYTFPNFLYILALQVLATLLLLGFFWHPFIRGTALTAILIVFFVDRLHNQPGNVPASDNMFFLVFGALYLREIAPDSELVTEVCLWFIALQSCLSYLTNGILKLHSPLWRQGNVMSRIFRHPLFGNARLARVLNAHPPLGKALDWSIIGCELLFPLTLVVGFPVGWVLLVWGLLFHVLVAALMGLNTFFFAWVATYPAIVFVSAQIGPYG